MISAREEFSARLADLQGVFDRYNESDYVYWALLIPPLAHALMALHRVLLEEPEAYEDEGAGVKSGMKLLAHARLKLDMFREAALEAAGATKH